jgi:hypothetical protein
VCKSLSCVSHGEEPSVQGASAKHTPSSSPIKKHGFIIGGEIC